MDTRDPVKAGLPGPFVSAVSQKLEVTGPVPTTDGVQAVVPVGATLATPEFVDAGEYFVVKYTGGDGSNQHQICGFSIDYTIPAGQSVLLTDTPQNDVGGVPTGSE